MSGQMNFGALAADLLIDHLRRLASPTGSRYVLEGLRPSEREALFAGLIEQCGTVITIDFGPRAVSFRAVHLGDEPERLLVPFLVDSMVEDGVDNRGNEGLASKLRDLIGHDARGRVRSLVTLTEGGNETQQSARDPVVDGGVLSLSSLAERLLAQTIYRDGDEGSDSDPRRRAIAWFCRGWGKRLAWTEALVQIEAFCEATVGLQPHEMGRCLGRLQGFLSDSSPDWADPKRLEENTESFLKAYAALIDLTRDPINTLRKDFTIRSIEHIANAGLDGLSEVDLAALDKPEESRGRTTFDLAHITVDDALLWRVSQPSRARRSAPSVLAVCAVDHFTVRIQLSRTPKDGERLRLLGWDGDRGRETSLGTGERIGGEGATSYRLKVDAPVRDFEVRAIVMTSGKRSFGRRSDTLHVVVYRPKDATRPALAFASDADVDLAQRAWRLLEDKAYFEVWSAEGDTRPVPVERSALGGEGDVEPGAELDGDEAIEAVELDIWGAKLEPRILWSPPVTALTASERLDLLEFEAFTSVKSWRALAEGGSRGRGRLRAQLTTAIRRDDDWLVSLGDSRFRVRAWDDHAEERAVGLLLDQPAASALSITRDADGGLGPLTMSRRLDEDERLAGLLMARRRVFAALRRAADQTQRLSEATLTVTGSAPANVLLLDLVPVANEIEAYLEAWLSLAEAHIVEQTRFESIHESLLALDALLVLDDDDAPRATTRRLIILPTHPWLLMAQLKFQQQLADELMRCRHTKSALALRRREVEDLAHPRPFEDWFTRHDDHLRRVAGAPFHWTYVPDAIYRREGDLVHLTRVVRTKIARYLRMHHHLEHERRTLRIGFVNPGDARHLLDGLRSWLKSLPVEQRRDGRGIPRIEVLLFGSADEMMGSALDSFFQGRLATTHDNTADNLLLDKLRYLKCTPPRGIPCEERHRTHICFAIGLVERRSQRAARSMNGHWDGCFGEGLLATPLSQVEALPDGTYRTTRGLWLAGENSAMARGLKVIGGLLRGQVFSQLAPGEAPYEQSDLPDVVANASMYEKSDWVVHLDREISLGLFESHNAESGRPLVIEYSDQEDPDAPGYDTVTVTRNAGPYVRQIYSILMGAELPDDSDDTHERQRRSRGLLQDVNAISGSWAIDLLIGQLSQEALLNRLKGNLGATLAYRWLVRSEEDHLPPGVVPLYVSLEALIRATPAIGLPLQGGLFRRFSNDNQPEPGEAEDEAEAALRRVCDDLLVLYFHPLRDGEPARITGRVIEVKFGHTADRSVGTAVDQVRHTTRLLTDHLPGPADAPDIASRHRQLSLLIKNALDQADTMNRRRSPRRARLDRAALSARLASGDYEIVYGFESDGRRYDGDAFILNPRDEAGEAGVARVEPRDGVRVVRMPKSTLHWLAFEAEDSVTLSGEPTQTLPSFPDIVPQPSVVDMGLAGLGSDGAARVAGPLGDTEADEPSAAVASSAPASPRLPAAEREVDPPPRNPSPAVDTATQFGTPARPRVYLGQGSGGTVEWDPQHPEHRLNNGHIVVLGASGAGKTQVIRSFIQELADQRIPSLILDFKDDYVGAEFYAAIGGELLEADDGLPINPLALMPDPVTGKVRARNKIYEFAGAVKRVYRLGDQQEAILRDALTRAYERAGYQVGRRGMKPPLPPPPTMRDVARVLESAGDDALVRRVSPLFDLDIFDGEGESLTDYLDAPVVIRLSQLPTEEVKKATAELVLMSVFNLLLRQGHSPTMRLAIVVDEAHRIANSQAMGKLLKEARAFGAAVLLSSQEARDFEDTVFSNAGSLLVLKLSETRDSERVGGLLGGSAEAKALGDRIRGLHQFQGLWRNDHYRPFAEVKIVPHYVRVHRPSD